MPWQNRFAQSPADSARGSTFSRLDWIYVVNLISLMRSSRLSVEAQSSMRKTLLLLALPLWTLAAAYALPDPVGSSNVTLTIVSEPDGAEIHDNYGKMLGKTGQPIMVNTQAYGSTAILKLRKDGYSDYPLDLAATRLGGRHPEQGAYKLTATSYFVVARQFISDYPWILPLLGLGAFVGIGLKIGNRRTEQQRKLRLQRARAIEDNQDEGMISLGLGGYRLIEILGRGGMATVYRGVPEATLDRAQSVAVKVLHRDALGEDWQRFQREVVIAKELVHPGIVGLIDYGDIDGKRYLVMECVEGGSLREALPLSVEHSRQVLQEVGSALAYAHSKGITHRDLKPENMMLLPNGHVKVMDFGLAKSDNSTQLTKTGTIMGTPAYMPPEQIKGESANPKMDQYALGILAYELFTGSPPFQTDDPIQMIYAHLSEVPPPPSTRASVTLPPPLDAVILKMLEKEPANRYFNIQAAAYALEAAWV